MATVGSLFPFGFLRKDIGTEVVAETIAPVPEPRMVSIAGWWAAATIVLGVSRRSRFSRYGAAQKRLQAAIERLAQLSPKAGS